MLLREIVLEQQLRISILLVHAIVLHAVVGIQQVHRHVTHQGYVSAVLRIDDEGVLHVALVTVGLDAYLVEVMGVGRCMMRLSALAFLLDHSDAAVKHVMGTLPLPAVLQVPLAHVGLVQKTIIIHVMVSVVVLVVSQHLRTQFVIHMDVGIDIGL